MKCFTAGHWLLHSSW